MRKLAVIMFTDIEGFTSIVQQDEDKGKHLHDVHRATVLDKVPTFEGQVIQFFGDGSLSIFSSPLQAILCAVELQISFCSQEEKVPVRIGLHQGDIIVGDSNIFGDPVNVASRIESLAVCGSILISDKVYRDIANKPEIKTVYFGIHHFKNVRQPSKIYAIDHPSLLVPTNAHPKAKTVAPSLRTNLPKYSDPFIGRQEIKQQLIDVLTTNKNGLISIVGTGGLGKTRLAVEVASIIQSEYTHGATFIALDSIQEHVQIPMTIGRSLGLKENAEMDWFQTLIDFLDNKELLLLVDNFEHVIEGRNILEELLQACPLITILCTTRRSLEINREIEFPLTTMRLPPRQWRKEHVESECILLFDKRAKMLNPNFSISATNYQVVADICHYLEGVPLVIELAAARIKMLSPQEIRTQLGNIFRILKSKKLPSKRHQTIYETIKWSFDLLDEEMQMVLANISVIPGNISIAHIEALNSEVDSFEVIEELFNHSLIYRSSDTHTMHYLLLRVIREFGQSILQEKNQFDLKRQVFSTHIYHLITSLTDTEGSGSHLNNFLDDNFENVLFAIKYTFDREPEVAANMLLASWRYFLSRGLIREAHDQIKTLLETKSNQLKDQAALLIAYGTLSHNLGFFMDSRNAYSAALKEYVQRDAQSETTNALNQLSWAEFRLGNYDKSMLYAEQGFAKAQESDAIAQICRSLNNQAWVFHFRGHADQAIKLQSRVLALAQSLGDDKLHAFALTNWGMSATILGKRKEAADSIKKGIEILRKSKNQQLLSFAHLVFAKNEIEGRQYAHAQELIDQLVIPIFTEIGDTWGLALALQYAAQIALAESKCLAANEFISKSLEIRSRSLDQWGITACHTLKAEYYLALDDAFEARRHIEIAMPSAIQMTCDGLLARLHGLKARCLMKNDQPGDAAKEMRMAMSRIPSAFQASEFRHKFQDVYFRLRDLQIPVVPG